MVLHLSLAALAAHNAATGEAHRLRVIFFEVPDEFPEIDQFVRDTVEQFDLDLVTCANVGFADGLRNCIAEHGSKAFVLGTRGSDPNAGGQQDFAPSSDWMPPFMRVNPILTWEYSYVWTFLRRFELPYSKLYDEGYTSLGKTTDTARNPALRRPDGTFAPAYELADGSLERSGRTSSSDKKKKASPEGGEGGMAAAADGSTGRMPTGSAALLIVGDEILGGKTADGNTVVAAKRLRAAGVSLKRVCVVPDEMSDIVSELRRLCEQFDVVLTSGGLGPTHDDITLKAVAVALGMQMARSQPMADTIVERYAALGKQIEPDILHKMSELPAGARIRPTPDDPEAWPILQCANVFVLPGVPQFFAAKLDTIATHFLQGKTPVVTRRVRLAVNEEEIVKPLNDVVASHPDVQFGSYPVQQGQVQTIITLEAQGASEAELELGLASLLDAVPTDAVVEVSSATSLAPPPASAPPNA